MEIPALQLAVDVPEFLYCVNGKWTVQKNATWHFDSGWNLQL